MEIKKSHSDQLIAIVFAVLTLMFVLISMINENFFNWVFERHHNKLSWYIRPLFLIPFCFFAFRRSWSGLSITIFCLFTSMFWFRKPVEVSEDIITFLQYEKDWLTGNWNSSDLLMILTIPVSFFILGLAIWKRSLWMGLSVMILMATGKIAWSVLSAGESGKSIIVPAVLGLVICLLLVYYGFIRLKSK